MQRIVSAAVALAVLSVASGRDAGANLPSFTDAAVAPAHVAAAARSAPAAPNLAPFEGAVRERMHALDEVMVEVEMRTDAGVVGHGSGVFVSGSGDVLTAAHVVADPKQRFRVVLSDGRARDASVVAKDAAHDAALLHVSGPPTPFVRAVSGAPTRGAWVVCAGYGGDVAAERAPMRSAGLVAEPAFTWSVVTYQANYHGLPIPKNTSTFVGMTRTDCATAPGMSGGPVVDLAGELVGVVVGSNGVVSPVSGFRQLLQRTARAGSVRDAVVAAPRDADPAAHFGAVAAADGLPSRDATLRTGVASGSTGVDAARRSVVDLELDPSRLPLEPHRIGELDAGGSGARSSPFTGVIVAANGLVVAPSVHLRKAADSDATISPAEVTVVGRPAARCVAILAVRGELALLRFEGLVDAAHRPIAASAAASLGEIVLALDPGDAPPSLGFVTAEHRHPGSVAPDGPRFGCGHVHMAFARQNPAIEVGAALASDVGWTRFGSLLVDRSGRALGMNVAVRGPGLSFAVPWPDVVERFHPWLATPR